MLSRRMNVLLINGHPRKESLSMSLTKAFANGATRPGVFVEELHVADLKFEPNVIHSTPHHQELEPDISTSMELITWADHLVFIYPTWWGTMPALLKAFIDRVFVSGFAFLEIDGGTGYAPLLRGKTAELITTMDTPRFVYNLLYRAPGHNAMKRAILQFCGIRVSRISAYGSVRHSTEAQRRMWLEKVEVLGASLRKGTTSTWQNMLSIVGRWLKAIRLQFYPMSFIAYSAGAFGAQQAGFGFDPLVFWLGYGWLFFLEVTTVLSNDYFDFNSDRQNRFFGPFTGGSRVLVDGLLSFTQVTRGIALTVSLSLCFLMFTLFNAGGSLAVNAFTSLMLFLFAIGYTVPPLKLSYRGLGELTVGLTHSLFVILSGYLFQGGGVGDSLPWLVSVPLFFSVLPSIILAGIPDEDADRAAGKRTLAVRWGRRGAAKLALTFTVLAPITTIILMVSGLVTGAFDGLLYGVVPHAVLLSWMLTRYVNGPPTRGRIDTLLVAALTYLMWFAIVPLVNLW